MSSGCTIFLIYFRSAAWSAVVARARKKCEENISAKGTKAVLGETASAESLANLNLREREKYYSSFQARKANLGPAH